MNKIWIAGLLLATSLFSCTDPDLIGLEVQPESDKIVLSSLDEQQVFTLSSIAQDSIRIDENGYNLLGGYSDPVFGLVAAAFSTHLIPSDNSIDFGENPVLDSAVLSFAYAGYYGDTMSDMSINVYELASAIELDSTYYSNESFPVADLLQTATVSLRPLTKQFIDGDTIGTAQIRIPMNALGETLLASQTSFEDNAQFLSYFKGVQLQLLDAAEAVVYLNLKNDMSKLTLYYKNDENDALHYDLVMGVTAARLNHFELAQNLDVASNYGIQSMGGYDLKLDFVDLDHLSDLLVGKVINKATLEFTLEEGSAAEFSAHADLSLVRMDEEGKKHFLTDFFEGAQHFGGALEGTKYVFNISKYLQELVEGTIEEKDLYLVPPGAAVNANRTLLDENVRLNIIYTDF